ncbi:MAG: MFS transporter [Oscillospiraceae bacterium]|nr:MFS transporter [Oscillospiraceae bacterium]
MKLIRGRYLLVLIAACGLASTTLGMMTNVAGVFFTPMAEDFGIGRGTAALTLTIGNLSYAVGGIFSRRLVTDRSFKPMVLLGTAIMAGATAAMAAAPNIWVLYVLNVIRGAAGGVLGLVLVTVIINNWLYVAAGISNSIAMACSGVIGAVMSPVLTAIISATSWRVGYLVAAVCILALNLPAIVFPMSLGPEAMGMTPLGANAAYQGSVPPPPAGKGRRDIVLFLLLLFYGMVFAGTCALTQHFPGLSDSYGVVAAGSAMLSVAMVANSGGKLLMGVLIQRIGTRRTVQATAGCVLLGLAGLIFLRSTPALLVSAGLMGFCYSQSSLGIVMMATELYGVRRYSEIYPKLSLGTSIANALSATLIGYLYDFSGGYASTLWLFLALDAAAIVCATAAYSRK